MMNWILGDLMKLLTGSTKTEKPTITVPLAAKTPILTQQKKKKTSSLGNGIGLSLSSMVGGLTR
jgi:hypothetical protein